MDKKTSTQMKDELVDYVVSHSLGKDFSKVSNEWNSLGSTDMPFKSVACPCGRMITECHYFINKHTGSVVALGDGCKKYLISYGTGVGGCADDYDGNCGEQIFNKKIKIDDAYYSQKLAEFYKVKFSQIKHTYKYIEILKELVKQHETLMPLLTELMKTHSTRYADEQRQNEYLKQATSHSKQIADDKKIKQRLDDDKLSKLFEDINMEIANKNMKKSSAYYPRKSFYGRRF